MDIDFLTGFEKQLSISETLHQRIEKIIKIKGMSMEDFYTCTNLNRTIMYDIRKNKTRPQLRIVITICIGLELETAQSLELIRLAGYALSKTRSIYQKHDAKEICRITNYRAGKGINFDGYCGQDVLVFEEFNSQIPIEEMLNYLDIYPLNLPARYNDRTACYTKVYITSNITLSEQYKDVQIYHPETWNAFLRRIHKVLEYHRDGSVTERGAKV